MAKILSKFGEQQLVIVNYACGSSQSETGKYFEWIIIKIILPRDERIIRLIWKRSLTINVNIYYKVWVVSIAPTYHLTVKNCGLDTGSRSKSFQNLETKMPKITPVIIFPALNQKFRLIAKQYHWQCLGNVMSTVNSPPGCFAVFQFPLQKKNRKEKMPRQVPQFASHTGFGPEIWKWNIDIVIVNVINYSFKVTKCFSYFYTVHVR